MTKYDRHDRGPLVLGKARPQQKLVRAIKQHEMSKAKIIKAVGISHKGMQALVHGKCRPRQGTAERICEVLGTDWEETWTYKRKPAIEGEAS